MRVTYTRSHIIATWLERTKDRIQWEKTIFFFTTEIWTQDLERRHWTTKPVFTLVIFQIGFHVLPRASQRPGSSYLCLPCRWDYRFKAYLLRWGLANFWPRLVSNYDCPNFCLLSSWDYRGEPPCLAPMRENLMNVYWLKLLNGD
jgi:hypothetical protein